MSVAEMRKAILEKVERLSEEQLIQVAQFVDSINEMPPKKYNLLQHAKVIMKERADVLKRLAE